MKRVGLTGGIACGKSTVAGLLRDRGVPVVDADRVAREVVEPGTPGLDLVIERFGSDVLDAGGALDRDALGRLVMADPTCRKDLEAILHPLIIGAMARRLDALEAEGCPLAVVEAALMVETGSYKSYDAVVVVRCSPGVQVGRLMARKGCDEATARRWIASQMPVADKARLADHVVDNDGDRAALVGAVDALLSKLSTEASEG